MGSTVLVLNFDRYTIPSSPETFGLKVAVNQTLTQSPYDGSEGDVNVFQCLKVKKGSDVVNDNEEIIDVATEAELSSLEVLPTEVNQLTSVAYGTISTGKIVTVTCPEHWKTMYGSPNEIDVTVTGGVTGNEISPALPAFANELLITIDGTLYVDGCANRDYTGTSGSLFQSPTGDGVWSSLPETDNRYKTVQSTAQSLVDGLNEATYVGSSEEIFQ